jgi:hypothetical protein
VRLPIVDNAERPVELDWLRIQRVAPAAPLRSRVQVRRDPRDRGAWQYAPLPDVPTGPDDVDVDHAELDALLAGELVAAVRVLLESGAPRPDEAPAGDGYRHEVEVSWGGVVHRYVIDGDPLDDALGGVLRLASPLLDAEPRISGVEPSP